MPPKVVCIVGPTGCGKTGLGVALAERLGGEVVSCDSMQLYRGMVIGTAAPTEAETRGVPHHMVGVIDPREDYSVARYAADAAKCVDGILARGKLPILVGGTGLYLDALLRGHGYAPGTTGGETRRLLERRWDDEGGEALFAELRSIDPESAAVLHPNDKSASSARSRSTARQGRPCRGTMPTPGSSRRATSPSTSVLPTPTARR